MTFDPTSTVVKNLNMVRGLGVGTDAVLQLLRPADGRGYELVADLPVDGGWTIEDGDLDQVQHLVMVEHGWLTRDVIEQSTVFAIDGKVYAIVGALRVASPTPNSFIKEWTFPVHPTGEFYP